MKRSFIVLGISLMGLATLPSCTKNLKDDVNDLQSQVDSLKKRNAALRDQAKATQNILGADEPITATTTYKDASGANKVIKETYSFKSGNYSTHYMVKKDNGLYEVYIERFSDVEWYDGAWCYFDYDPATKTISNQGGGHYWRQPDYDYAYYNAPSGTAGCEVTINLKSIDVTTGQISVDFSAAATAAYTTNNYNFPNPGQACATNFSFAGKLSVLQRGY
ncbi:hypothetical protein [Paraflavitalea sp. CAU 1676]|uniref:hypothetical protein n=1 Tax=Paraflavitalea sp. CAU 1676 TaxID=3032598 RepID=UPI0023D9FFEA|nr:hypothetical protein [Paraflavitalea sp. CAU 1676]MDF2191525.1 hypothetical protein [Paraflavitalea sp. CAU 1676]